MPLAGCPIPPDAGEPGLSLAEPYFRCPSRDIDCKDPPCLGVLILCPVSFLRVFNRCGVFGSSSQVVAGQPEYHQIKRNPPSPNYGPFCLSMYFCYTRPAYFRFKPQCFFFVPRWSLPANPPRADSNVSQYPPSPSPILNFTSSEGR